MDIKAILETLDINDVQDLEDFKEKFSKKFVSKKDAFLDEEVAGKITGRVTGLFNSAFKREFELEDSEIKGKKWEEIIPFAASKLKAQIEELKSSSQKNNDELTKDLQAKLEKKNKEFSELKSSLELVQLEYGKKESEWQGQFKNLKLNTLKSNVFEKVKPSLKEGITDLELSGFESHFNSKYALDLDEEDNIIVTDKSGNRLKHPTKTGAYMGLDEVFLKEATEKNIIKKNNAQNTQPTTILSNFDKKAENKGEQRALHPSIRPRK